DRCDDTSPTRGGDTRYSRAFARGAHTGGFEGLRDRVDVAEAENASLRAMIRTMEAVETVLRNHKRQARIEIECQLASVQEFHRQDREDFRKLKDFMTSQYGYCS
ncbi:hypothetical protein Tco_0346675, partial [Tanacetum coccineum]